MASSELLASQERVIIEDVKRACDRAADLLLRSFVMTNEFCGWHQYLGQQRTGPPATAIGLAILQHIGRDFEHSDVAKKELYKNQFSSEDPLVDGGWTIRSIARYPITESTAWVTHGLLSIGEWPAHIVAVQKGLKWLVNNQNNDVGWGAILGNPSRAYSTYWATQAIAESGLHRDALLTAGTWIRQNQNGDGGWGEMPGRPSTPAHTAFSILALLNCGEDPLSGCVQEAVTWLYKRWDHQKMWDWTPLHEEYDIVLGIDRWDRIRIRHFQTQWVLVALLRAGAGIFKREVFQGINWIIQRQRPAGYWHHPAVGDQMSIWGVHASVLTLTTFINSFGTTSNTGTIDCYGDIVVFNRKGTASSFRRLLALETTSTLKRLVSRHWSLGLAMLYLLSIYPSMEYFGFTWKEILVGMILPLVLVFYQLLLSRSGRRDRSKGAEGSGT